MAGKDKRSLGESLVDEGLITSEQLATAHAEEKRSGLHLRKALVKLGFIEEEDLVTFLSSKLNVPKIELENCLIDPAIIDLVPEELARKYELIPVLKIGKRLTCAMLDPWNIFALDEVRMKTNFTIEPAVSTEKEIKKALDQYYGARGSMDEIIKAAGEDKFDIKEADGKEINVKKLEGITEEPVVVRIVNLIVMEAIREGASDIHIEPEEHILKIRLRVDGLLHEVTAPPKHLQPAIISRIKILAKLDIAERRVPQDGRFTINMEGREIDIRVSCMPTIYGENIVLRLLDVSTALVSLEKMGFSESILEEYRKLIHRPHGIILVTGPTGSGKTTTLYASLDKINTVEKNIITIEDPVEYKLEGIRQMQVNSAVDLTFAAGLRSILRQDPDVIMVGEIRDFETAEIAIQAALTGHLVFSTIHTNDAAGAFTRLIDMGVEPFLISSSVIGVLAQRLVRKVCPECKEQYTPPLEELKELGLDESEKIDFYKGNGCDKCSSTGYKGRAGIYELIVPDDTIQNMVIEKVSSGEIRKHAISIGTVTLKEDGANKVKEGISTVEEILRVTQEG